MDIKLLTLDHPLKDFVVHGGNQAMEVFNEFGLDFCCGGAETLRNACSEKNLSPDNVLKRLYNKVPSADFNDSDFPQDSAEELADHIENTHHLYLKKALPDISELMEKVKNAHSKKHPELFDLQKYFEALRAELEPHLRKEENILFPLIRQLEESRFTGIINDMPIQAPVRQMLFEHDHAGDLLKKIREITKDFSMPEDGCASYQLLMTKLTDLERDTHEHIHKENNLLFPKALEFAQKDTIY